MDKVNPLVEAWVKDHVVNDIDENMRIAEMSSGECLRRLNIGIDRETCLAFYSIVYDQIIEKLKQKRETDPKEFAINIADIVTIGYDNVTDSPDEETSGNFNVYVQDGGRKPEYSEDPDLNSQERCTEWMSRNVKEQPLTLQAIASMAVKQLNDQIEVTLSAPEAVFPIWAIIHSNLLNYLKIHRSENNSYEEMIEFAGTMEVFCRLGKDNEVLIVYKPHVADKLNIKSNVLASAPEE